MLPVFLQNDSSNAHHIHTPNTRSMLTIVSINDNIFFCLAIYEVTRWYRLDM